MSTRTGNNKLRARAGGRETQIPALEKDKNVARIFGTYFENIKLQNETELATNVITAYNAFEGLMCGSCGENVNHIFNSRKQFSVHELPL